jgi:hypothetical protein
MNNSLLRKYIRESLGREVMLSPERLRPRSTGGELQRELTVIETIDKTNLSDEEVLEELIVAAGPDTYIRFEKKYGDLEFPPLKVSPQIKYQTPHGIYGYPLNQVNVENLVHFGAPTSAYFATAYDFFHIYKLDKSRTANVTSSGDHDLNRIIGRYATEKKVIDDIAECIRVISYLFHESKHSPPLEITMSSDELQDSVLFEIEQDIAELMQNQSNLRLSDIFNKYKNYVVKSSIDSSTSKKLIEVYKQEIATAIFKNKKASMPAKKRNENSTKQFLLFKILKSSVEYIAENFAYSEGVERSQYYSLLLKSIGITGITDLGTSSIHDNEPSQAVSFDFSGDTVKPIGTFKNIFKSANFNDLKEKFNQILEDLTKSNIVSWNSEFYKGRPQYDYKNISLKYFKILVKSKKNNPSMLKGFINNIALKNKNSDVLSYIYDNKDSLEVSGIKDGFFGALSRNKFLPERISNEFYKDYVKDNIDESRDSLQKKLGHRESYFAFDFVQGPALTKEAMFEIIEKSKSVAGSFAMQALRGSKHLDREVSEMIIEKFGAKTLFQNSSAPITDYYLKHLIEQYNLFTENLTSFNDSTKDQVVESLCEILRNPHAKDGEIKYIILKLSPLLKEISNIELPSTTTGWFDFSQYVYFIMYGLSESKNITQRHIEAASLSKEEKINILKIFTYILYVNDEEMNYADQDDDFEEQEFNMLNQGLQILSNVNAVESAKGLRVIFRDAYEYFVNAKKLGID